MTRFAIPTSEMFDIDSPGNRTYLPADRELAADMDLSLHPSRHVSTYVDAIEKVLDETKKRGRT
ncbi:AHH domain-containing protein [Bradyrhizobium sp. CCGUVB1N3]|uniref:AHH domain-containing protein n=1 Tax=Bradyrhizobium sp. CCGUVB1N3 TaxID=2949629 RepID=UPI003531E8F1